MRTCHPWLGGLLCLCDERAWEFSVFWMEDMPGTIYPLMGSDFGFDEVFTGGSGEQLDDLALYGDGIVVFDGSLEAFA